MTNSPITDEMVERAENELIDRGYDGHFYILRKDLRAALEAALNGKGE